MVAPSDMWGVGSTLLLLVAIALTFDAGGMLPLPIDGNGALALTIATVGYLFSFLSFAYITKIVRGVRRG